LIHDAHTVALRLKHGISELITGDRDLSRFEGLKIVNPFAGPNGQVASG
jgi:predicted nucleic acid-binding protein